MFVDDGLKIFHATSGGDARPLFAQRTGSNINFFVLDGKAKKYISVLKSDMTIEFSDAPVSIEYDDNPDGTFSVKLGTNFLSARRESDAFSSVPRNLAWEHLFLFEADVVQLDNLFTVHTFHGTQVLATEDLVIKHRAVVNKDDLPLYAEMSDGELSLLLIRDNVIRYVRALDGSGNVVLSDERCLQTIFQNASDDSISFYQNDWFWSARRENDTVSMTQNNQGWEHFFLRKVNELNFGRPRVVIVVPDGKRLDEALDRLNVDRLNVAAVLSNGAGTSDVAKRLPMVAFAELDRLLIDNRDDHWLVFGDEDARRFSEYVQSRGLKRNRLIDITPRMKVTPTWLANVRYAVDNELDYFATGDLSTAVGLDLDQIFRQKGVNLAADGQDLRQSYLTAKYIFERGRRVKFVLIGLTPESLMDAPDRSFAERGRDVQYIFPDGGSTLDDRVLHSMLFVGGAIKSDAKADPNLLELKKAVGSEPTLDFTRAEDGVALSDDKLRLLEDYIRLCIDHGVVPVGLILPSAAEKYSSGELGVLRRIAGYLEKVYDFKVIDLSSIEFINPSDPTFDCDDEANIRRRRDLKNPTVVGNIINYKLRAAGVLPVEEMRFMNYERIHSLHPIIKDDEYVAMMDRIFAASIDVIKRKDKIKVGFVIHDDSTWCGDRLYNSFAQNDRYETTIFFCLRTATNDLVTADFERGIKMFRAKGMNVVGVSNSQVAVPKQDVLFYLTPFFYQLLPLQFKDYRITAETLVYYTPYTLGVGNETKDYRKIYLMVHKLFVSTKLLAEDCTDFLKLNRSRVVYSGSPKMDALYPNKEINFDWKMTRTDALKIIWAPHWSIAINRGNSTFRYNYKFMYEYARAHPEISWIVKPHFALLNSVLQMKLFPTSDSFMQYVRQWNELPNARFLTGAYYQDIFSTSDAMIFDCFSFVVEYLYTLKPMLYLTRETTVLNDLGQKIIDANYHVDGKDFKGIEHFIEDVLINKHDPQRDARMKVFDQELNYVKDNGMLASEMIFKTIDDALKR